MNLTFEVKISNNGVFVTSPDIPGLLVSERTIEMALKETGGAIRDLLMAAALETARGNSVAPVIRPR